MRGDLKRLLFTISIIFILFSTSTTSNELKVNQDVLEELDSKEEVNIIVYFKDSPNNELSTASVSNNNKDNVLSTLTLKEEDENDYDFEL
jgi:hypothetical protein